MTNRRAGSGLADPTSSPAIAGDILLLGNYYHPEQTGIALPMGDLSFWLAEQGLQPNVLTARPSYPQNRVYEGYERGQRDHEHLRGVEVRRVWSFMPKSRGAMGRLLAEGTLAISALLARKRTYGRVICACPSVFSVLIAPAFKARGGRLLVIVHDIQSGLAASLGFGLGGIVIHGLRLLETWSLNRCDVVVALTDAMAGELKAMGVKAPIVVIPPQVDVREIVPEPARPEGAPLIVYSGNLGRKQGLDQVLTLAAELQRRGNPARLLIRGEGSERADLEVQAREEGLTNLAFADLAPRERISQALGEATLHLVPQRPGGANFALPSKIFSIMAAERPYVATADPGTPLDLVTRASGAGVCVEPHQPELFADAVERLLVDAELSSRLGRSGRRYVETVIDREVVCRAILDA